MLYPEKELPETFKEGVRLLCERDKFVFLASGFLIKDSPKGCTLTKVNKRLFMRSTSMGFQLNSTYIRYFNEM